MKISALIALLPALALAVPLNGTSAQDKNSTLDSTTLPPPLAPNADPTINLGFFDDFNVTGPDGQRLHGPKFIFGPPGTAARFRHAKHMYQLHQLHFDFPLKDFIRQRNARDPKDLIWDSPGCTDFAPNTVLNKRFDFTDACHRHVFLSKNYQRENAWTVGKQQWTHRVLLGDMQGICEEKYKDKEALCLEMATLYFQAVGGKSFDPKKFPGS